MPHLYYIKAAGKAAAVFVAMGSTLATMGCHQQQLPEPSLQSVRTAPVEEITAAAESKYSAVIIPSAEADLDFKSPGVVAGIRQVRGADNRLRDVGAGDFVFRGTELAHVRAADYQQGVDQAEAQTAQAKAQIADATASYENARLSWSRSQVLFESGSLIKPQYDQAKSAFDSAQARITEAKAGLASADAGLAHTKLGLTDTVLRAPFSGWITARNLEAGSLASASTVAFSMMDTHLVKASFAVPDVALMGVHLGSQHEVQLDALANPVQGTITAVSQQADAKTHVFTVELTIPNAKDLVRPGMICTIRLNSSVSAPHLIVPLSAVVRPPSEPSRFAVYALEERDGKTYVRSVAVALGDTYGNSVEVLSGLSRSERIVSTGASFLQSGQQVRVVP